MENLKIYHVSDDYVKYLSKTDRRVQFNKNSRRPYVGIVLYVGQFKYFVPMESPKENHKTIKPGIHLFKLDGGSLGLLGFNNMIPVSDSALIYFDINAVPDQKYAQLLKHQLEFINRNKADILSHASGTYYKTVKGNNKFLNKICCNFKALEKACSKWNPSFVTKEHIP